MSRTHIAETLLLHRDFVHRMAVALVGAVDAADLCQDLSVRALVSRPVDSRRARSWLGAVLQNLARNHRRHAARRRVREAEATTPLESAPDVAAIVAGEEARQRVVAAVLALPDDLREVVVLRYYEDLDSNTIGARLRRPAGTVRWQLSRALEQLRRRLDEQHGGRAAWAPALGWWQGRSCRAMASLVRLSWRVRVAGALLIGVLALWAFPLASMRFEPEPPPAVPPILTESVRVESSDSSRRASGEAADAPENARVADATALPRGRILGTVRTQSFREPAAATVTLRSALSSLPVSLRTPDQSRFECTEVADAAGAFVFEDVPAGSYKLLAETPVGAHARSSLGIGAGDNTVTLDLRAPDKYRGLIVVKVRDEARQPIANAEVTIACVDDCGSAIGYGTPPIRGRTASDGVFRFEDTGRMGPFGSGVAVVRAGDQCATVLLPGSPPYVEVTLGAAGAVVGTVQASGHREWTGGLVRLESKSHRGLEPDVGLAPSSATVDANGRFRIEGVPAGYYRVHVTAPGFVQSCGEYGDRLMVEVRAGATAFPTVKVVPAAVLRGRAVDETGNPSARAEVSAYLQTNYRATRTFRQNRFQEKRGPHGDGWTYATTRTDENGCYELSALAPGAHDVLVAATNGGMDVRVGVEVVSGQTVELQHQVVRGGAIHGVAGVPWVCIRADHEGAAMHLVSASTGFDVAGLAPGRYQVGAWRVVNGQDDLEPLELVTVTAGAKTWVDLRRADACVIEGAAFALGIPVAGVDVRCGDATATTSGSGSFALAVGDQLGEQYLKLQFVHRAHCFAEHFVTGPAAGCNRLGSVELSARQVTIRVRDRDEQPLSTTVFVGQQFDEQAPLDARNGELRDQWVGTGELWIGNAPQECAPSASLAVTVPAVGPAGPFVLRQVTTGRLRVRLVDADGSPVVGACINMLHWNRPEPAPRGGPQFAAGLGTAPAGISKITDRNGAVEFDAPVGDALVCFTGHALSSIVYSYNAGCKPPPVEQVVGVGAGEPVEVVLQLPR